MVQVYILTITDGCTRWSEAYILYTMKTAEIIEIFKEWVKNNPKFETCSIDQALQFTSDKFKNFCQSIKLKINVAPQTTRSYSLSKRINKTITRVLQT